MQLTAMGKKHFQHKSLLLGAFLAFILQSFTSTGYAQDTHRFTFNAGAGASPLVGDISTRLDNGWNVTVGGGYNFSQHFAATLQYTYNGFGVNGRVLAEAQVPEGNSHLWSLTVDPKLRLTGTSRVSPYLVGGVGFYRRTVEFTQPALTSVFFFDPFFGVFFNTLVPAHQVLGDIRRSGVGGNLGAGLEVKLGDSGVKGFAEARYEYAATGRIPTRIVPVRFGFRW
jgi:opacity protein-like surface antigen